jgi:hypothetical protein
MMNRRKFAMMYSRPQYCSMAQGLDTISAYAESRSKHKKRTNTPVDRHTVSIETREGGGVVGCSSFIVLCAV